METRTECEECALYFAEPGETTCTVCQQEYEQRMAVATRQAEAVGVR